MNIDYSSAAVGLRGHCNDYNITTEDASAARGARGARPLDLKEESDCSVLEQAEGGILEAGESLSGCYFLKAVRETRSSAAILWRRTLGL